MVKSNIRVFENDKNGQSQISTLPVNKNIQINQNQIKTQSRSVIKQESVEYILPAVPIDASHRIDYYYPLFYKTHVVDYYESIDYKDLKNTALIWDASGVVYRILDYVDSADMVTMLLTTSASPCAPTITSRIYSKELATH